MKKSEYKKLALSYTNDFLSVERFADYYSLSIIKAYEVIRIGKILHEIERGKKDISFEDAEQFNSEEKKILLQQSNK